MTREQAQEIVARARPGWRVTEVTEVDDESGPSFEIQIEHDGEHRTLLVAENEEIAGERP